MGISRQAAQRLVSLAIAERLVRVWMEHPIARCLELAARLTERFGLVRAEVVPTDPGARRRHRRARRGGGGRDRALAAPASSRS